ncbi:MAG TPA: cellulose synthase operon protein YhjQ/BcsQ [Terriglobales bacterium]|jgi:pilus assembly protein CpaE|nr:cellulose synthase operon protein YhjQ/BcsQ [Terriglobales bacterium]
MPELSVAVFATDNDQRAVLQVLVDGTSVARTVCSNSTLPLAANDPVIRKTHNFAPDVVLVDIAVDDVNSALRGIELLHQELPEAALFAVGPMTQPQLIVSAMRAGVREYIERPTTTTDLLEAFVRLTATRRKPGRETSRGKVFTVVNAKGGSGATTVAVNLALALQSVQRTALVDLAPLGHCALHLNLKPAFTVSDAITNLHRLDSSLLESFMSRHDRGLQVLAGPSAPTATEHSASDFARLFDTMVGQFHYIVVDASSRLDSATRLVSNLSEKILLIAHADVASLWSAGRVAQYLGESGSRDRFALVLNRYRKVAGFNEAETEAAIGAPVLWRIPNQYFAVSTAIDRGVPLMQQGTTEIARSISGLAEHLTKDDIEVKRSAWSLFKTV